MAAPKTSASVSEKFSLDFASLDPSRSGRRTATVDPPGFSAAAYTTSAGHKSSKQSRSVTATEDPNANLKMKKAWDVVLGAAKSIPMNAFMMWMAGSSVQIFSIMITGMMLLQPIKALQNVNTAFERYQVTGPGSQNFSLILPKLAFVGVQLAMVCMGIYKCSGMGLLPTTTSDWLAFLEPREVLEYAAR